jgi:hypothetical protein
MDPAYRNCGESICHSGEDKIVSVIRPFIPTVVTILILQGCLAGQVPTRFPDVIREVRSPNGRDVIENVDADSGPFHSLILRDLRSSTSRSLLQYQRYVDVLWSKDGDKILVNDHGASDHTDCLVFVIRPEIMKFDVGRVILQQYPRDRHFTGNHHLRFEGREWRSNDVVRVRVSGYGDTDPAGFRMLFEYTVGKDLSKVE